MSLLLESIKTEHGSPCNLEYHQQRVDRSSRELFNTKGIDLKEVITAAGAPGNGIYKCRILYNEQVQKIEFVAYSRKIIQAAVFADTGDYLYPHKFADRSFFNHLKEQYPDSEELILVSNGLVTDSSFSNLAFYDGFQWLTPEKPLLAGTRRQQLLDQGRIRKRNIRLEDVQSYDKVSFINAMLDLGEMVIDCTKLTVY